MKRLRVNDSKQDLFQEKLQDLKEQRQQIDQQRKKNSQQKERLKFKMKMAEGLKKKDDQPPAQV